MSELWYNSKCVEINLQVICVVSFGEQRYLLGGCDKIFLVYKFTVFEIFLIDIKMKDINFSYIISMCLKNIT